MNRTPNRVGDQRLLSAIQDFVATHPHPDVQRFNDGIAEWGQEWLKVSPTHLPVTDTFASTLSHATDETRVLLSAFIEEKASRKWEQSYTQADGVVGRDMLADYGFAEVIGKLGPFVSTRIRSGIGVWGPNIVYPAHRHQAEEVYVLLAGSAEFQRGQGDDASVEIKNAGDVVFVPSKLIHGFRTMEEPLVVFYIWQAGDLREISTFV